LSALKKYNKIVDYLQSETFEAEKEKETCAKLKLAANLNIAACCLKTKEYRQVIEACNKAIELDTNSEKAYFRMAQAYYGRNTFSLKTQNQILNFSELFF
jgi:FK506-binding protein 4/5